MSGLTTSARTESAENIYGKKRLRGIDRRVRRRLGDCVAAAGNGLVRSRSDRVRGPRRQLRPCPWTSSFVPTPNSTSTFVAPRVACTTPSPKAGCTMRSPTW